MSRKRTIRLSALSALLALAFAVPATRGAEVPPLHLTTTPQDEAVGSGAGRFGAAKAVAVDPVTRHVFVLDWEYQAAQNNARINEFTAWGEFVKAFGWGVRNGAGELQSCTAATGCQKGIEGTQPGQLNGPNGIAFDAAGDLYVFERLGGRVQKFDPTVGPDGEGAQFLLEWGSVGTGDGQFTVESVIGVEHSYIAIDPSDDVTPGGTVYVADKGRIQAFDTDGNFQFKFALPQNLNPGALAFNPVNGDLYFSFNQTESSTRPQVYRLKVPSGQVVDEFVPSASAAPKPLALAVDPVGDLYVLNDPQGPQPPRVQKFSSGGELKTEFAQMGGVEMEGVAAATVGKDAGEVDVYVTHRFPLVVASLSIYGAVPDPALVGDPPLVPPSIVDQFAVSATETEAILRARINPNFWNDTTYYVEYGPAECRVSSCTEFPSPPGSRLTARVAKATLTTQGVFLTGLRPGVEYFYRFVARSTGGGPVYGIDPDGANGSEEASFEDGLEASFTTRSPQLDPEPCPANEAFRPEPAKKLPDCRAYEMVSPVDKNGADISVVYDATGFPAGFEQTLPDGEALSFSSYRAFGDAVSAPYSLQYIASRSGSGWSSRSLAPPREGETFLEAQNIDAEYKALSADLSEAFLFRQTDPILETDPEIPAGYPNLYRRDNSSNTYEALIRSKPFGPPEKLLPTLQGYGGGCGVFQARDKLASIPKAGSTPESQLYKHCPGQPLELVSVLPSGTPASAASAGTGGGGERQDWVEGAVSRDGQVVFWSDRAIFPGKIYARIGSSKTIALSKGVARFWGAASDGSKAIFEDSALREFTLDQNSPEAPSLIAGEALGVLGASDDASIVYFLSREARDGAAQAGEPNLYRYEAESGTLFYIATLSIADVKATDKAIPGPVQTVPVLHSSQVTPDGEAMAFTSTAPITGFDNRDANTDNPDSEVFVYRADEDRLVCVSCGTDGVRPSGREVDALPEGTERFAPTAGELPSAANSLYAPRVISNDGGRVYFNSYVPLVRGDTNGRADVYQWEALGKGGCKTAMPGYGVSYRGCVNLISSGESPRDSTFVDSSVDGRDVFFKTNASLLPQDPGLVDIYDARERGGFPLQTPPPPSCQGEACQNPAPPPLAPTPSSQVFSGPGNVKQCPRGTRKVRSRGEQICVRRQGKKKKVKAKKVKAKATGRASR